MATEDIGKAVAFLRGVAVGDADLATRHLDPDRYVEHDPEAAGDAAGLRARLAGLPKGGLEPRVVRALQDGELVVVQVQGERDGLQDAFEVFRFAEGRIAEHWRFSAATAPPNRSGHTQLDGPAGPAHLDDTAANKAAVRAYYETVHLGGRHGEAPRWFAGDLMIRHEPGVADGASQFLRDLEELTRDRTIDAIRLFAGEGDLVFLVAEGTHRGAPCAYVDLYRVQHGRIVEHWGFPQPMPGPDGRLNRNGML